MCHEKTCVNLRIEGATTTHFEGNVCTCGHLVTTRSGGTHHCNGTNNNNNDCVGPTCITALDDGNRISNFGFDGTFDPAFDDFFIRTIKGETPVNPSYWQINLNFQPIQVGGCQQKVKEGDQVLFAVVSNTTTARLKLTGPRNAVSGTAFNVKVTNETGAPIQGATVKGQTTNAQGIASITFSNTEKGIQKLKATKANTVRSNAIEILVR
ncbi:hypothetical protein BC827DRAFT_218788 [Russula dissimulans]|nr:hypothetical protein BC827DRAFT_218788 [Russula dissimulans]